MRKPFKKLEGFFVNHIFEEAIAGKVPPWSQTIPPKKEGDDPILRRPFELACYEHVTCAIPKDANLEHVDRDHSGRYTYLLMNGVGIHFRDKFAHNVQPGQTLTGTVLVYVLVWEPKDAHERGGSRDGGPAFANYAYMIDFVPSTADCGEVERELTIIDCLDERYAASEAALWRDGKDTIVDPENAVFTHRVRIRDVVRDVHIEVLSVKADRQQPTDDNKTEVGTTNEATSSAASIEPIKAEEIVAPKSDKNDPAERAPIRRAAANVNIGRGVMEELLKKAGIKKDDTSSTQP